MKITNLGQAREYFNNNSEEVMCCNEEVGYYINVLSYEEAKEFFKIDNLNLAFMNIVASEKHLGKLQLALNNLQASNLQKLIDKGLMYSQEDYDKKTIFLINNINLHKEKIKNLLQKYPEVELQYILHKLIS